MKYQVLALAIAVITSNSYALSGKIVDGQGIPVAGARIEVIGTKEHYRSNREGQFDIPHDQVDEIHIEATGFSHKVLHLHGSHPDPLIVTLTASVLDVIDVVGLPLHASKIESAQPISVLAGDELQKRQASTLGETLKYQVGVQSTYYGGVASSPIIRGLDGPRVLITQNGLDVGDASRVGPDHSVTGEASTAEQIEILRGPATLFYGSGAIGGVVNIVDDRVPQSSEPKVSVAGGYNTVNEEAALSAAYTGGSDVIAVHLDGFWRDGKDYKIPGAADYETEAEHDAEDHEQHQGGKLENSASESSGLNIGASWLLANGYIGLSYGRMEQLSGVPGHGGIEDANEVGEGSHSEETILADLKQDRWQLLSEFQLDNPYITAINARMGYTQYQHAERHAERHEGEGEAVEEGDAHGDEEATLFKNTTWQARLDLIHEEIAGWKGAFGFETKLVDFEAVGEEAFTPPSETREIAVALIEEKHIGPVLLQLGARLERVSLRADNVVLEYGHEEDTEAFNFDNLDYTPLSISAGAVWDFTPGYNLGVSIARAERAPNSAELFSVGPHIATRAFEAGALFEIHQVDSAWHLDYNGTARKETSHNLDLTLRKFEGGIGYVINLFYNRIADYYYLANSGLTTDDVFADTAEDNVGEGQEEHLEASLPVYIFQQRDAVLYGVELELAWQFHRYSKWIIWGDQVHAELDNGAYIPRTPSIRLANQLQFNPGRWSVEVSAVKYFEQDHTAVNERATEGYTLWDARISYKLPVAGGNTRFFVAANNLTDEEARVHTSFLKDQAPLPGRNIRMGLSFNY